MKNKPAVGFGMLLLIAGLMHAEASVTGGGLEAVR
jgi:hypothetical protein